MQELSARAALVSAPEVSDGLTASVPREEVAEALRVGDTPPDLILDVTRFSNGDPAETRNLVVAWERGDLEELLRQTEGDQVVLTFDREAIRQAMEADVEAHGIREKALVLAVAAVAATGAAANASAGVSPDDRAVSKSAPAATAPSVSPDDRAVSKATSVGQVEIPYLSHGTLTPEAAAAGGGVSPDDRAVSMAAPATGAESEAAAAGGGVSPDDRAVSMAAPATGSESEAAAAEIPYLSHGTLTPEAAAAGSSLSPDDRAVSMAAPATGAESEAAAAGSSLSPDDRAVSMAAPAPADVAADDSGISISAPSPTTAVGIGAAVALAITGAAFAVAGRRRVTPA
jgi:hypothetical protein